MCIIKHQTTTINVSRLLDPFCPFVPEIELNDTLHILTPRPVVATAANVNRDITVANAAAEGNVVQSAASVLTKSDHTELLLVRIAIIRRHDHQPKYFTRITVDATV